MVTDNVISAGNQQERPANSFKNIPLDMVWYLVGFVDGEGSFNVSFRKRSDYGIGWKLGLSFNISQKDPDILYAMEKCFGCGTVRFRKDGVGYYEVCNFSDIQNIIIPFFDRYQLKTKKRFDFLAFRSIAKLVFTKQHLTRTGLVRVLELREQMNGGGKRKFTNRYILETFRQESSETTRQT